MRNSIYYCSDKKIQIYNKKGKIEILYILPIVFLEKFYISYPLPRHFDHVYALQTNCCPSFENKEDFFQTE